MELTRPPDQPPPDPNEVREALVYQAERILDRLPALMAQDAELIMRAAREWVGDQP